MFKFLALTYSTISQKEPGEQDLLQTFDAPTLNAVFTSYLEKSDITGLSRLANNPKVIRYLLGSVAIFNPWDKSFVWNSDNKETKEAKQFRQIITNFKPKNLEETVTKLKEFLNSHPIFVLSPYGYDDGIPFLGRLIENPSTLEVLLKHGLPPDRVHNDIPEPFYTIQTLGEHPPTNLTTLLYLTLTLQRSLNNYRDNDEEIARLIKCITLLCKYGGNVDIKGNESCRKSKLYSVTVRELINKLTPVIEAKSNEIKDLWGILLSTPSLSNSSN